MCNKPGGAGSGESGKVPKDKISKGSQGMEELMKGMQDKQGKGEKLSSKDFAQAAARQAAMRKALQDMQKDAKEQGKGTKELEAIIEEMDKLVRDVADANDCLETLDQIFTTSDEGETLGNGGSINS